MLKKTKLQVVAMLVDENHITLINADGQVIVLNDDSAYDTEAIITDLQDRLNGLMPIDIDLEDFKKKTRNFLAEALQQGEAVEVIQVINDQEVEGVFIPKKPFIQIQTDGEQIQFPIEDQLERHAQRAVQEESPSVRNFLRRLTPMIQTRRHSAEELLNFIKKSDLPLTDDGCIIGYKRVNQHEKDVYKDVHSGKVHQRVGSVVWMDVNMVNPDRNSSCAQGLHVASRSYLKNFTGEHTLIVLVKPENFISVPYREDEKARVCEYQVIGVLSEKSHKLVTSDQYIKDDESFENLMKSTIKGHRPPIMEKIKVGDRCVLDRVQTTENQDLTSLDLEKADPEREVSSDSLDVDGPIETPKKNKETNYMKIVNTPMALPKDVEKAFQMLQKAITKTKIAQQLNTSTRTLSRWIEKYQYDHWVKVADKQMTVADKARQLFIQGSYQDLVNFRKAKKKGYKALGFTKKEIDQIEKALG